MQSEIRLLAVGKLQKPNPKHQRISNEPSSKRTADDTEQLGIGIWRFCGVWSLEFGISRTLTSQIVCCAVHVRRGFCPGCRAYPSPARFLREQDSADLGRELLQMSQPCQGQD